MFCVPAYRHTSGSTVRFHVHNWFSFSSSELHVLWLRRFSFTGLQGGLRKQSDWFTHKAEHSLLWTYLKTAQQVKSDGHFNSRWTTTYDCTFGPIWILNLWNLNQPCLLVTLQPRDYTCSPEWRVKDCWDCFRVTAGGRRHQQHLTKRNYKSLLGLR